MFKEILVESAEFEKKRKELLKARQSLKQAEENYEAQAKMHESSVSKYNEVYAEMVTMRSIMLKVSIYTFCCFLFNYHLKIL